MTTEPLTPASFPSIREDRRIADLAHNDYIVSNADVDAMLFEIDRLSGKLAALEAAALDAIEKIDAAADGRINFRRDFAMRLREAMGIMKLASGDWSDPR